MRKQNIYMVLAGHANVGKSVIFNQLTGLHQHIGNWPGKTIEKAEGTLHYKGCTIDVLDLPGIYSLSTYSLEELITREHIVTSNPDFIANIVDATNIERNLLLTLQLLELKKPLVLALNMVNLLKKNGITIDFKKLEKILGVPVVPVIATHGKGLTEILDRGIDLVNKKTILPTLKYGKEVEECIEKLSQYLQNTSTLYPPRFIAIKLLEKDHEIEKLFITQSTTTSHPTINNISPTKSISDYNEFILEQAKLFSAKLEKIHGHDSSIVIANERCCLAAQIVKQVMTITKPQKTNFGDTLDYLTGHKIWGYPIMLAILFLMFSLVFKSGNYFATKLEQLLSGLPTVFYDTFGHSLWTTLIWSGIISLIALIEIAIPYILPFYFALFILEDWGYLARVAYLMDRLMHNLGVHGKACIPLILGFGCNVPACLSCRIMETGRERFITALLTVFVPCSAITVVIAGLVGKFLGISWALGLYLFIFLIIFAIGKIASFLVPGEPTELIMEMPSYRLPNIKNIALRTWIKLKEFIYIVSPVVIISGIIIEAAYATKILDYVNNFLAPITSQWLGLPTITGVLLILGILRKELILVMLATLLGTTNFAEVLTPIQILILGVVSMLYIPCAATIAVLYKEFGWKKALLITMLKIVLAIVIGGAALRIFDFFKFNLI